MSNSEYFNHFFDIVADYMSYLRAFEANERWHYKKEGKNKYKNYGTFRVMKSRWLCGKLK